MPFEAPPRDDGAAGSSATGSPAAVPQPELAAPPAVLVLGSGWRLALARAVDGLATAALAAGLLLGALSAVGVRAAVQPVVDRSHADPVTMAGLLLAVPFCAVALYQAVTVLFLGGTLGCRLAGLRVVRQCDGARPGAMRALVRGLASALGTLLFGSGPLWGLLIDRRRRGLGDVVASSVVVRAAAGDRA